MMDEKTALKSIARLREIVNAEITNVMINLEANGIIDALSQPELPKQPASPEAKPE